MSLLALALVTATPSTIAQTIDAVRPGDTIVLQSGTYQKILIKRTFDTPITIDASGSTIRGLTISGGGVRWKSGTFVAPRGTNGVGTDVYGALVTGTNVSFSGVTFSTARKGLVLDRAKNVMIADSFFRGVGEDGIIAARTVGMVVVRNTFDRTIGQPTTCRTLTGIIRGLARWACEGRGGVWTDGYHADAVQMRDGVTDVLIADNVVNANTQGLTQMDTAGDAPLRRVHIMRNSVSSTIHQISLAECYDCVIRDNVIRRYRPDNHRAVIRPGLARRCQNDTVDEPRDGPCR